MHQATMLLLPQQTHSLAKVVDKLSHLVTCMAHGERIEFVKTFSCIYWLTRYDHAVVPILESIVFPLSRWIAAHKTERLFALSLTEVCSYYLQSVRVDADEWAQAWTNTIRRMGREQAACIIQRTYRARHKRRTAAVSLIQHAMLDWYYRPGNAGARHALDHARHIASM